MRIALAIPLLLLGACQVSKDDNNGTMSVTYNSDVAENAAKDVCNVSKSGNSVSVQYDQNTAENTAADIGNTAQNIAADIGNDVKKTGDKIENKVGNTDVSVKVNKDEKTGNAAENKAK